MRLPAEEEAFYRRKAGQLGVGISAFLTKTLVAGVVAENIQDIEERLRAIIASVPERPGGASSVPDHMILSLLTCEALLSSIVESQDIQLLYRAQEAARARMKKIQGG